MFKFHYFNGDISPGFVSLFSARMTLRVSTALLGLFLPIFLYRLFEFNIIYVLVYYMVGHILYAVAVPWGCQYLNKLGLRRSLRISVVMGAFYYLSFYFLDRRFMITEGIDNGVWWLLASTLFFITLHRIMYWTPMHTDMAKFTNKLNRGKQLSLIEATTLALGAVMPLVAGYILSVYNYEILFLLSVAIYLASLIPLMTLPKTKERFSWTYLETWKEFLSQKRKRVVLACLGDGAESVVGLVIWPIFIWELLRGNFFEVGALSSLIVSVTVILQLLMGRYADQGDKKKMLRLGSVLYALGWVFKIFILTSFQIFIASTYHNLIKIFARTPFDALSYEKAADQGHFVDEFTVVREMAIQFGKVFMLLFISCLVYFVSLEWAFVLAALASIAMNFMADEQVDAEKRLFNWRKKHA